ncbi:MAG: VOC family protein, partial [Rhodobacterales bacterium]
MMLRIDHLAIVATRLEDGVAAVEDLFGVPMAGGGKHPL